jgi:hypothetical protein
MSESCPLSASGQTETKVDTEAIMVEVEKACAQRPSQVLASVVWTAYLDRDPKGEKRPADLIDAALIAKQHRHPNVSGRSVLELAGREMACKYKIEGRLAVQPNNV